MKSKRWALVFAVLTMIFGGGYTSQAQAETFTLSTDNLTNSYSYVFPSQVTNNQTSGCTDSSCGGAPIVTQVEVTWTTDPATGKTLLQTVTFTGTHILTGQMSLFINTNAATGLENWNYYVLAGSGGATITGAPSSLGLYAVSGFTPDDYTVAGADGRNGVANGISAGSNVLSSVAGISDLGLGNPAAGTVGYLNNGFTTIKYDFSALGINSIVLNGSFDIGWTQACANQMVLVEGTTGGGAVPEPATLVLFGMGMVGLAGWQTRRVRAAQKK